MGKLKKLIPWALLISASYTEAGQSVLDIMNITPSAQSIDYMNNKKQFQLYSLVTEQRHQNTYNLSYQIENNTGTGLQSLLSVDQDISKKFTEIASDPKQLKTLETASKAIQEAILNGHRIYFYGTGSTGRLAEAVESSLWRPFWEKLAKTPAWPKVQKCLPDIQNRLKGEITGGDRALISSLEGFEDLPLIGKLQLEDNKIQKGDVVFAVTEGGETSAVIGTILAAADLYSGQRNNNLYFMYNNPDSVLLPFDRSRSVIENPLIKKISLPTGPQSITGSTRMQATTTSLYASGVILEDAVYHVLEKCGLSKNELKQLGFSKNITIQNRLRDFKKIQSDVYASAKQIVPWTNLEAETYATHHRTIYFAQDALLPVFIDVTERAPTFRLAPLDTVDAKEKHSWIQVWAPADTQQAAWDMLLHRSFHGLDPKLYQHQLENIDDPYLKETALKSLARAGQDQQNLYDLAFSKNNIDHNGPTAGDLGVMVLLPNETLTAPRFWEWIHLFADKKANLTLISVAPHPLPKIQVSDFKKLPVKTVILQIPISEQDPFELNQMIALKMLLNAHSTAVMAKLGRVVGNTMTDVQPGNLKLIGRATYLIQLHVNAVLSEPKWRKLYGKNPPITFTEANAVLYDAINYVQKTGNATESPEVALSIIRILEALKSHHNVTWEQAEKIFRQTGLQKYLAIENQTY